MNTKFKNIHYLNMFTNIETEFKTAIEMLEVNNAAECFFHLKMCVLGLESLLIKDTEWFKTNKKLGYKPTYDEILKRLEKEKVLNSKQIDLFTTICNLSESYDYYDKSKLKKKQKIETLNILCTRLDNEIPSIMARLGVGGASRLDYLNNIEKEYNVVKSEPKEKRLKGTPKDTSNRKTSRISLYLRLRYLGLRFVKWFNKPYGFVIKFVLVLTLFCFLVSITFINKKTSKDLRAFNDNYVTAEFDYINDTVEDIPDAVSDTLSGIGDLIMGLFDFLKFE